MLLRFIFLLSIPWFTGGKKPNTGTTYTDQNPLSLRGGHACKGGSLTLQCPGKVILLDTSSQSGLVGKGLASNNGSCDYHDDDDTLTFDLPDWILKDCTLKFRCSVAVDRILGQPTFNAMEYVLIYYYCIERKPVYDICEPVTAPPGSTAYLISHGYPNMPFIDDITTNCECTGEMGKHRPFQQRILDSDFRSVNSRQYDCTSAQTLKVSNTKGGGGKVYDCNHLGGDHTFGSIYPKGKNDFAEISFTNTNRLTSDGGRFILEYIHDDDSFELECNPGRVMPLLPSTTTTTTTPTTTTTTTTTSTAATTSPTITTTTTTTRKTTTFATATTKSTTPSKKPAATTLPIPKEEKSTPSRGKPTKPSITPAVLSSTVEHSTTNDPTAKALGADSQTQDPNLGMIIGIVVLVLVIAVVAIVLFIYIRKRRTSNLERKSSQVDLVESSSNLYQDPTVTLQTPFNSAVENDYCDADQVNAGRGHTDSDGSLSYSRVNPLYELNIDSGDEYSVIDNKHVRIEESKGSFRTDSQSSVGSFSGKNVPVYAVVNKKKHKEVPLYAQVMKKGKRGQENLPSDGEQVGTEPRCGLTRDYSFENKLASLPYEDGGMVGGPTGEDTYQTIDTPRTYSLEDSGPGEYSLEESGGYGPNEYLDVLSGSVEGKGQGTGVPVAGEVALKDFRVKGKARHPIPKTQQTDDLGSKAQQTGAVDTSHNSRNDSNEEYVYTYSHFPNNKGKGSGSNGTPVSSSGNGNQPKGSPALPKGRQTEPEYALYDADHTYASIEGTNQAGNNMPDHGQSAGISDSDPMYFLYESQGGATDQDGEEYQYIPRESATGAEQIEEDIYHDPDSYVDQSDPVYATYDDSHKFT